MLNIAFMASHGGSGMKAVLEALHDRFKPVLFIGNNAGALSFEVAEQFGMPTLLLNSTTHDTSLALDRGICNSLREHQTDLLLLSGYMKKLGPETLSAYQNRILNIHPSLLPKYGGQGMYGDRVHAAVLAGGEQETGASVHLVDAEYDQGPVLQQKTVKLSKNDALADVREKVKAVEGKLYVQTLQAIIDGQIILP